MTIEIKKVGDLYTAVATSSIYKDRDWKTEKPMEIDQIIKKLLSIGYHQMDIYDALYYCDPVLVGESDK